jgi:LacI family transcriptional regulator
VSYVVNNGPRPVAPHTRDRVLAAIEQTNYRPNGIAKALAAGSSRTYGLVVPDISNPFFAAMAHALEDEVFASGRVLLLGDSAESKEREREIVSNFLQRQVDGLLYIGTDNHIQIDVIAKTGTPVVVLDRISEDSPAASVVVDNVLGARVATEHLVSHGYTEIGIISGPEHLSTSHDRFAGWEQAMRAAGLPIRQEWVTAAPFSKAAGLEAGRRVFAGSSIPQAIFATSDQQAVGLLRAASEARVRVPEDVAVITFDGTEDAEFSVPPLSTIRQPIEEIAKSAVGLLLDPDSFESNRMTCVFELVLRRSCGCIPEK